MQRINTFIYRAAQTPFCLFDGFVLFQNGKTVFRISALHYALGKNPFCGFPHCIMCRKTKNVLDNLLKQSYNLFCCGLTENSRHQYFLHKRMTAAAESGLQI